MAAPLDSPPRLEHFPPARSWAACRSPLPGPFLPHQGTQSHEVDPIPIFLFHLVHLRCQFLAHFAPVGVELHDGRFSVPRRHFQRRGGVRERVQVHAVSQLRHEEQGCAQGHCTGRQRSSGCAFRLLRASSRTGYISASLSLHRGSRRASWERAGGAQGHGHGDASVVKARSDVDRNTFPFRLLFEPLDSFQGRPMDPFETRDRKGRGQGTGPSRPRHPNEATNIRRSLEISCQT
eukprot:scaffold431_cov334-Pavlova_lutheri.AAC.122